MTQLQAITADVVAETPHQLDAEREAARERETGGSPLTVILDTLPVPASLTDLPEHALPLPAKEGPP